jgi:hypothetical protein
LAAVVKASQQRREKRFPAETLLKIIKAWQEQRVPLRRIKPTVQAGTFAADVERYTVGRPQMPTLAERKQHLRLWTAEWRSPAR